MILPTRDALASELRELVNAVPHPEGAGWAAERDATVRRWLLDRLGLEEHLGEEDERVIREVLGWHVILIAGVARLALLARSRVPELP